MKNFNHVSIKTIVKQFKTESISMRRRFYFFIMSAIAIILSLILLLFHLFGIMNPTNRQIMEILDTQLLSYTVNIQNDYNKIAAHAISFSEQLEPSIQKYLTKNNITFEDLKNNPGALADLQNHLYDIVYLNMQLAPSSGAFYILDTSVNTHSETPQYNGIYLKYINIYSENTVNNDFSLYRGSYTTGKENNLTFHSGWQNEMQTDFFNNINSLFADNPHYILSPTVEIPETWERARYVYVPIYDLKDNIIGICGFEISDLYFQLSKKVNDDNLGQLIGALLDEKHGMYSGQFNSSRFNIANSFVQTSEKGKTTVFDFNTEKCIGRTQNIRLGNNTFTVAIMLTEAQYENMLEKNQFKTIGVILFIVFFALIYCIFISKKYVSPIIKSLEQIKSNDITVNNLKIREIDDLFAFLEEKDILYEKKLQDLEKSKKMAEEEAERTKSAYEKALEEYALAQSEIQHLSEEHKKEIILEDYEFFLCNLSTLSPAEYKIYELYLSGKTAKEIVNILGIKENTLKYHNKNIYSKLGISSRKQLLRFAALKQHQDRIGVSKS
ncbi:MAG: hypothetical protein II992_12465 [Lachnospiraceae bacterium]|nr:hypothetical protein [Lachnospiraceae bacterium]